MMLLERLAEGHLAAVRSRELRITSSIYLRHLALK